MAFHVLATRALGPASYGALGSLLAVLMVLAVPIGAMRTPLGARAARLGEGVTRAGLRTLTVKIGAVGCAAAAVVWFAGSAMAGYLRLPGPGPLLWLGAYLVPLALGIGPWSFLRGTGRLGWVGTAATAGFGVRLGVGALLLSCGFGLNGAMAAMVLGEWVLVGILGVGVCRAVGRKDVVGKDVGRKSVGRKNVAVPRRGAGRLGPGVTARAARAARGARAGCAICIGRVARLARRVAHAPAHAHAHGHARARASRAELTLREAGRGSVSVMGLWTLLGIDLVAARHFLAPDAAGAYAAAALASRAVLTVAHTSATAGLRRFAVGSERRAVAALWTALLVAVGAGAVGTCVLVAVGPQVLGLLFGRSFAASAGLDLLFGLDATVLAALGVLMRFRLARHGGRGTAAGWAGSLCFVVFSGQLPLTSVGLAAALGAAASCALAIVAAQVLDESAALRGGFRLRGSRPDTSTGSG